MITSFTLSLFIYVSAAYASEYFEDDVKIVFDIPSQQADLGLLEFARQAELTVAFPFEITQNKTTNRLVGYYTIDNALNLLLQNTGLFGSLSDQKAIKIESLGVNAMQHKSNKNNGKKHGVFLSLITLLGGPWQLADAQEQSVAGGGANMIEEVTVTATRRETQLMDTPVSMTALSGDTLESRGIKSPTDLENEVPNLSLERIGGAIQIRIRGITSNDISEKGDPSVAFMMDGVYISRPQAIDTGFYDINRVEVLRGPQGTLYGRNTTAGVVHVITNKPVLDEFSGRISASYGNYDSTSTDGYVNFAVTDTLAIRASGNFDRRNNYLNLAPGDDAKNDPVRDNKAGRLQAYWEPSNKFDLLLRTDFSNLKGSRIVELLGAEFYDLSDPSRPRWDGDGNTDDLLTRSLDIAYVPAAEYGVGVTSSSSPAVDNDAWSFETEANWNLGAVTATYVGSFREYQTNENIPVDFRGLLNLARTYSADYQQQSHELRFTFDGGERLQAQTGLYYFQEEADIEFNILEAPIFPTPVNQTTNSVDTNSIAVYGELTVGLTDRSRLTLGGRYTDDDKERFGNVAFQQTTEFNPSAGDFALQNAAEIDGNITDSKFTWRTGLEFDVLDSALLFVNVAEGYKAGGFGNGCVEGAVTNGELCNNPKGKGFLFYEPEELTSYEIGFKNRFNDAFQVSSSLFHYDYTNLQLSALAFTNGVPQNYTTNAGKAEVDGLEVEATYALNERHRFDLAYTWLDAKYTEYCPFDDTDSDVAPGPSGCIEATNLADTELDRSPKSTFMLGYSYFLPFKNGGSIQADIRSKYSTEYNLRVNNFVTKESIAYPNPSMTSTNLTLTYRPPQEVWYVQAFVKNLENDIRLRRFDSLGNANVSDPRTYGIRASYNF